MSTPSTEKLELQALEQRNQLHHTAAELKEKVVALRQKFDPVTNVRQHFTALAAVGAALGLMSGYAAGGLFTHR